MSAAAIIATVVLALVALVLFWPVAPIPIGHNQVKNPLLRQTPRRQYYQWLCDTYGCITTSPHYKMPQASCRRCGHKTRRAIEAVPEWTLPWFEYEPTEAELSADGLAFKAGELQRQADYHKKMEGLA